VALLFAAEAGWCDRFPTPLSQVVEHAHLGGCLNAQDQKRAIGLASAAASAPVFCILMLDACPTSG
jgi:hypothetical protein